LGRIVYFSEVHKAKNKHHPYDIVALKKVLMKNEKEGVRRARDLLP
jgi:hypothetical protein